MTFGAGSDPLPVTTREFLPVVALDLLREVSVGATD